MISQQHVNQHAAVLFGIPDAQVPERLNGAISGGDAAPDGPRIESSFDRETNLSSMERLRLANGSLDGLQGLKDPE